jgi:GTP 3',8-cyclase
MHRRAQSIGYLRLSLTRACQLRCIYCRPDFDRNTKSDELTCTELQHMAGHMVQKYGVKKIRLTGGDPTARKDLITIIEQLRTTAPDIDLAMTTHGLTLAAHAHAYAAAGLQRVNVSIDSLDSKTFARLTGADVLQQVINGIDAAVDAFAGGVKLNVVVIKNQNEHELVNLLYFAAARSVEVRFIEIMPMGELAGQWHTRFVSEAQMRARLDAAVDHWTAFPASADSARRYVATLRDGREVRVGFITPMSCNFCARCDRLRIASDGSVFPCLMDAPAGNVMRAVRPGFDAELFDQMLFNAYAHKKPEHPHDGIITMTHIGG